MTKAELIEALSNKLPLNKADAERAINIVLDDVIAAAEQAGALGAALSGAGGSVIAITDRRHDLVAEAMKKAARVHRIRGRVMKLAASATGAKD